MAGLFNEMGLNKKEARELVNLFFQELEACLADGEQICTHEMRRINLTPDTRKIPAHVTRG